MAERRQQGFTLIEILITVAVIGILAGVAIPRIGNSLALQELDNAARDLAGDIRLLELMAQNSNDGKGGGAGSIVIPRISFINGAPYGYQIFMNDGTKITKYFPVSVSLNKNPGAITSSIYDGKITIGTIGLASTKVSGAMRFIKIQPMTGRVRVDDHL